MMFFSPFNCPLGAIVSLLFFLFSPSCADHAEKHELPAQAEEGNPSSLRFPQVKERIIGNIARGALTGALGTLAGAPTAFGASPGAPLAMGAPTGAAAGGVPQGGAAATPEEAAAAAPPPVDLDAIEAAQDTVDEEVESTTKLGNKLKEAVDMLSAATQSHVRKGINYSATVVQPPPPPEEQTGTEITAAAAATGEDLYTAPVIVLLPPEPSPTEKMEFARAMSCLGKLNSLEMRKLRKEELLLLTTIKGKNIQEINKEIVQTKEELTKAKAERRRVQQQLRQVASDAVEGGGSQADILFLRHDLQLYDEKIIIFIDKLNRLDNKLNKLKKEQEEGGSRRMQEEEEETEEAEEEEEGNIYKKKKGSSSSSSSSSSKNRAKQQKMKAAATAKPRSTRAKAPPTPRKRISGQEKRNKKKPRFIDTDTPEGLLQHQQQLQQQLQLAVTPEELQQQKEYHYHLQQMQLEMQRLQQQERDEQIKDIPTNKQINKDWRNRSRKHNI